MINKQEKGFAIVLSLVLLMAMTLMGGALIVISAGDHKSNNISDEYQQTFYVAETALYEGEKYIMNQYKGPYDKKGSRDSTKSGLPINNTVKFEPKVADDIYECFHSFADIKKDNFYTLKWNEPGKLADDLTAGEAGYKDISQSLSYYDFIAPSKSKIIIEKPITDNTDLKKETSDKLIERELKRLKKFRYHYFITRVGSAPFKGYGTSIKKGATDSGNDGVAYRVYGCGEYDPNKNELGIWQRDMGKIIVPLESTLILPK